MRQARVVDQVQVNRLYSELSPSKERVSRRASEAGLRSVAYLVEGLVNGLVNSLVISS